MTVGMLIGGFLILLTVLVCVAIFSEPSDELPPDQVWRKGTGWDDE